jgi:hypothetical protein
MKKSKRQPTYLASLPLRFLEAPIPAADHLPPWPLFVSFNSAMPVFMRRQIQHDSHELKVI